VVLQKRGPVFLKLRKEVRVYYGTRYIVQDVFLTILS